MQFQIERLLLQPGNILLIDVLPLTNIFPQFGPKISLEQCNKNLITGHVEQTPHDRFNFDAQLHNFNAGYQAADPSISQSLFPSPKPEERTVRLLGDGNAAPSPGMSRKKKRELRKVIKNNNAADMDNFTGPFGKYENQIETAEPSHVILYW